MRNMNHLFLICSIGISKGTDLIWRTDLEKKTFCLFYMLLYFFCLILHFDVFRERVDFLQDFFHEFIQCNDEKISISR